MYETKISKNNFKQPDAFLKYVKFLINDGCPKLWNNYDTKAEKNIVSTIFFKQRIKEKLLSNKNELRYSEFLVFFYKRIYLFKFYFQSGSLVTSSFGAW